MDPRHSERIKIIQNLFAATFPTLENNLPYPDSKQTEDVRANLEKIDSYIKSYAPKYPVDRLAKTDLCILRLAIYELVIDPKEPKKVVINEAVELAKEFGGERSYAFVNAVLGMVVKSMSSDKEDENKE